MNGTSKVILGIIGLLVLVGLNISLYLTWTTWNASTIAGCGGDGLVDCEHVLASKWSKWLGQPVSLLGALGYTGMLGSLIWVFLSNRNLPVLLLLMFAMMAAGSALWFIGLQVFVLQSFCLYCMGVHTCSLLICGLTLYFIYVGGESEENYPLQSMLGIPTDQMQSDLADESEGIGAVQLLASAGVASLGVFALVLGQFLYQPPGLVLEEIQIAADENSRQSEENSDYSAESFPDTKSNSQTENSTPEEGKDISEIDGESFEQSAKDSLFAEVEEQGLSASEDQETSQASSSRTALRGPRLIKYGPFKDPIDVTKLPIMGNPDAEHVLIEMLDYTCPHCRELHPHVHAAIERYGDQLAFVIIHVPLSKKCNPLIKRDHYKHKYACEYARMALGIWQLDPDKFLDYHEWLMKDEKPPSTYDAKRRALDLVGEEILIDDSLQAASFRNFAGNSKELQNMHSGLPVIVTEQGRVRGIPNTREEWFEFLEKLLDIKPADTNAG